MSQLWVTVFDDVSVILGESAEVQAERGTPVCHAVVCTHVPPRVVPSQPRWWPAGARQTTACVRVESNSDSLLPVWAETLRPPSSIHKPPADHHYTELSSTQAPVLPAQWFTVIVSSVLRCAALCLCCLGPGEQQPYRSSKCWDTCLMSSIAQ